LDYINEALLTLYSKFPLREADVILKMFPGITMYRLLPKYSVYYTPTGLGDNMPHRYILDQPTAKFKDEVIKITEVWDNQRVGYPLDDPENPYSLFRPQAKTLQVPNPKTGMALNVVYQTRHPELSGNLSELVEIPDVLLAALTSYVAYKAFSHSNTVGSNAKSQEFLGMFQAKCADAVDRDLVGSSISRSNTRFERGGWV
jgi:hypothetical protein